MVRKIFAILLIGIMQPLAMLHAVYGLGYISLIYLHQESNWEDFTNIFYGVAERLHDP